MTLAIALSLGIGLTKADAVSAVVHSTVNFVNDGPQPIEEKILLSKDGGSTWNDSEITLDTLDVHFMGTKGAEVKDAGGYNLLFAAKAQPAIGYVTPGEYYNVTLSIGNDSELSHLVRVNIVEILGEEYNTIARNVLLSDLQTTIFPSLRLAKNGSEVTRIMVQFGNVDAGMQSTQMNLNINLAIAGDQK